MSDILTLCECPLALCEWPFELCECLLSYVGDLLSYASDLLSCVSDLLSYVSDPHSEQLSLWQCPVSMVEQEGDVLLQWTPPQYRLGHWIQVGPNRLNSSFHSPKLSMDF